MAELNPRTPSSRLRLQDGIAALFIVAFIALGVLTWRHLQEALADIRRDAADAGVHYQALREVFAEGVPFDQRPPGGGVLDGGVLHSRRGHGRAGSALRGAGATGRDDGPGHDGRLGGGRGAGA